MDFIFLQFIADNQNISNEHQAPSRAKNSFMNSSPPFLYKAPPSVMKSGLI